MGVSFELGWDSKRQGVYSSQGPNKKRPPWRVSGKRFNEGLVNGLTEKYPSTTHTGQIMGLFGENDRSFWRLWPAEGSGVMGIDLFLTPSWGSPLIHCSHEGQQFWPNILLPCSASPQDKKQYSMLWAESSQTTGQTKPSLHEAVFFGC